MSTRQFDYLVERVRSQFESSHTHIREKVYFPMDEGGMTFISAEPLNADGFGAFTRAVMKAKTAAQGEETFSSFQNVWDELIEKLRSDPRFEP